jgi:hypothetical protein
MGQTLDLLPYPGEGVYGIIVIKGVGHIDITLLLSIITFYGLAIKQIRRPGCTLLCPNAPSLFRGDFSDRIQSDFDVSQHLFLSSLTKGF